MKRRTFLFLAALPALPALTERSARAQTQAAAWPERPIRWILSQPAGSGPDIVARMIAERVARGIGQTIVIDNKPGGQNVIGAQAAAASAADGHNFYFATTAALVTNRFLFKNLPYDPLRDFAPVAFVASSPFAVLVNSASPAASIEELLSRSRSAPGSLTLANEGPRTFSGMIARLVNARAKMQANLVSYASVKMSIQDVLGGHADAMIADVASSGQLVRDGRLRMLAVTSPRRIAGWDQVPALAESMAGIDMVGWFGLVAPAGTPEPVVDRMNQEMTKALQDPSLAEKMLAIGPIATPSGSAQQFGDYLRNEHERLAGIVLEIGLLPE